MWWKFYWNFEILKFEIFEKDSWLTVKSLFYNKNALNHIISQLLWGHRYLAYLELNSGIYLSWKPGNPVNKCNNATEVKWNFLVKDDLHFHWLIAFFVCMLFFYLKNIASATSVVLRQRKEVLWKKQYMYF